MFEFSSTYETPLEVKGIILCPKLEVKFLSIYSKVSIKFEVRNHD